jgi:Tfp pilus assembly protein PilN
MRPVNLIPPEERRGERAPMRTGPLAYVIVAVLAVATVSVVTDNQISDRKAEKANLQAEVAQAEADAKRLSSFANFASLQQAREETVSTLARSRFDWERVLRELAIVIPSDVWLTNLSASASGDSAGSSSSTSSSSASSSAGVEGIVGPSLEIQGCAAGHEAVARFIAALHDIDGVTRVTVLSSDRPDAASSATGSQTTATGSAGCSARGFVAQFDVVAAFDAVQLEAAPDSSSTTPAPDTNTTTTPASTGSGSGSGTTASSSDQGQVADAQQQLQQQKDSASGKAAQGRDAVSTFVPGTASAP